MQPHLCSAYIYGRHATQPFYLGYIGNRIWLDANGHDVTNELLQAEWLSDSNSTEMSHNETERCLVLNEQGQLDAVDCSEKHAVFCARETSKKKNNFLFCKTTDTVV